MDNRDHALQQLRDTTRSTHPVDVGQRSEATIIAELLRRGFRVTGRLRGGIVNFSTQSVQSNTARRLVRGYTGGADLFLVYCPGNRRTYAVPVDQAPTGYMNLRIDPPLSHQASGVR